MTRTTVQTALIAAVASLALAACGSDAEPAPATSSETTTTAAAPADVIPAETTGRATYETSPAGVTTAVRGVDVDTSSPEYVDACRDAYFWVAGGEGTPAENAEGFLALLQTDPAELGEDPADGVYWADQNADQHAAVIAAINAAAAGEC